MEIVVLHVPNCPNLNEARGRLQVALDRTGVDATVREVEVASTDVAQATGMHGSPTLLVNGRDPFAAPGDEPSLSCRLYRSDGLVEGSPTVSALVAVLTTASSTETSG